MGFIHYSSIFICAFQRLWIGAWVVGELYVCKEKIHIAQDAEMGVTGCI